MRRKHLKFNSDTMPYRRRANTPQPAAAAAPWTRFRAADATMATHAVPTMGGISKMPIAALLETDLSHAIPAIPELPASVSTGYSGPPLFDLSNNDFYNSFDVVILDNIEEFTNELLCSGMVFPTCHAPSYPPKTHSIIPTQSYPSTANGNLHIACCIHHP